MSDSDITRTLEFMKKGFPNPQSKNQHTQLGVHFEEIGEMLEELASTDRQVNRAILDAYYAINVLSKKLKETDNNIIIRDRLAFLDSICDQLVTATGVGYVNNMDVAGGFGEVNRSNLSKFDKNGEPIFDQNLKLIKGPDYVKANLEPFV